MADYVTDGKIGIDLTAIYASASAGSTSLYPANPGDTVFGSNNSEYMFVRAESTIAQYDLVAIATFADSASSTAIPRAVPASIAGMAGAGVTGYGPLAIAQVAITSAYYGWVALNGTRLRVNALIACEPKVPLYCTSTAGSVDDTTVTAAMIQGLTLNTSATSASAPFCMARNLGLISAATSGG